MQKYQYLCTMKQVESNIQTAQDTMSLEARRRALLIEAGFPEGTISFDEIESAEDKILEQQTKIQSQNAQLKEKESKIAKLEKEIARLKMALEKGTLPKADSHNSSVPPSQDKFGIPHTSSQRKCTKDNGGQPGHEGSTLTPEPHPDLTLEHKPQVEICPCCGLPVDYKKIRLHASRQVIDIPEPVRPIVTEHRQMEYECPCGNVIRGEFPKEAKAPVSYGPNVKATVAYLSTLQTIPFKRLAEHLATFYGIRMSQGTISNILNEMREYCKENYEAIYKQLIEQEVLGGDESGIRINGINHWMWVFQTAILTYIIINRSRGRKVLEDLFPEGLPKTILITDRWAAYFKMLVKDHQLCLAHLLRNTFYFTQLLPKSSWPVDLMQLFRDSIERKKQGGCSKELREEYLKKIEALLDNPPMVRGKKKQKLLTTFVEGLKKHKEHIFTFLEYEKVEPDNNSSERAVRPVKTKMKVSGQFKSLDGAQAYASIHSIVQTARKRGLDPYECLITIAKSQGEASLF